MGFVKLVPPMGVKVTKGPLPLTIDGEIARIKELVDLSGYHLRQLPKHHATATSINDGLMILGRYSNMSERYYSIDMLYVDVHMMLSGMTQWKGKLAEETKQELRLLTRKEGILHVATAE